MLFSRKKYSVELSIPEPCAQDWNEMRAEADGRHCAHCQKTVVDFTGMTDAELLTYFKTKSSQSCGRFYADQLERTIEEAAPQKPRWWLRVAASVIILLGFAKDGKAQEKAVKENTYQTANRKNKTDKPVPEPVDASDSVVIKGTLVDEKSQPIINGIVTVDSGGITLGSTVTDYDGNYSLKILKEKTVNKKISVRFSYQASKAIINDVPLNDDLVLDYRLRTITMGLRTIIVGNLHSEPEPFLQPKGVHRTIYFDRQ